MFISDVKTYHCRLIATSHEINLQSAMRIGSVFSNLRKKGGLPNGMGKWGKNCIAQNSKITHAGLQLCNNG